VQSTLVAIGDPVLDLAARGGTVRPCLDADLHLDGAKERLGGGTLETRAGPAGTRAGTWCLPRRLGCDSAVSRWARTSGRGVVRAVRAVPDAVVSGLCSSRWCIWVWPGTRCSRRCRRRRGCISANPDGAWTAQAARNTVMALEQRLGPQVSDPGPRQPITTAVDAVFEAEGIKVLRSPAQAPRAHAICERVIGTLRRELLDRILILGEEHLRRVLAEYLRHYNHARPHRTLGQLAPAQAEHTPPDPINLAEHHIRRRAILGGLTHPRNTGPPQQPETASPTPTRRGQTTRIALSSPTPYRSARSTRSGMTRA